MGGGVVVEFEGALHFVVTFLREFFFFFGAVFLQLGEFGDIGFALVAEAALLQSEVGEIAAIGHEDFALDEGFAIDGVGVVGELIGEFEAADGVDAGFERGDAEQAPFGIGDRLDERFFFVGSRERIRRSCGRGVVGR